MTLCNDITITVADRQRLGTLIDNAATKWTVDPRSLSDLEMELERAAAVDPHEVPGDVVTMNSTVRLRDLNDGETFEYTLVYPRDANAAEDRVSILAPIGTAILGCRAGDVVEWPVPAGVARLQVEEVVFQPERAGDFDR
jgi:regulator of nucleoside diphosphate kinase